MSRLFLFGKDSLREDNGKLCIVIHLIAMIREFMCTATTYLTIAKPKRASLL